MRPSCAGDRAPAASSDGSICDSPSDTVWNCHQSPLQPQIMTAHADDVQLALHAWASSLPNPEAAPPSVPEPKHSALSPSVGCLPGRPEAQSSFHLPGNSEIPFESQSDRSSLPSVHFLNDGASLALYNLQQQPFASTPAHSSHRYLSSIPIPKMTLDREYNLCPGCYATPFPSVWTMDYLGCVHCEIRLPRLLAAQPDLFPAPVPPHAPAVAPDRPRPPSICSPLNRFRKGPSPTTRGRRSAKTLSPTVHELRCCPFTTSGNVSLPCPHLSCAPPPDVAFLSRRFVENGKWEKARKDAVASFDYEKCGFHKLPIEIVWMIVDFYPRLDYSYMRSIRAEPSIYNHRFEALRNLIGVSRSFRTTFHTAYWDTFEIALTYPRRRAPDPGLLELGMESARYVSRVNELQGLRKMFWNLPATAACVRTLTFRVDRDSEIMQLFVDCLLALPNLHTLEIAPTSLPLVTLFGTAFKHRPQYRCIRKLVAPSGAHPILQCLPNLEELVCTRGEKPHILLTRVFQAYDSLNTVASFRSFELIGTNWTDMVGKELIRCFPSIRKLAMRKPSVSHLEKLTSLTEISELELWVLDNMEPSVIKRLKAKAVEILRKSNPRTVCKCGDAMDVDPEPSVKQEPETNAQQGVSVKHERETEPLGCGCEPPKRVFRLKHLVRKHGQWGTPFWGSERVEEIEVSPLEG